MTLFEEVLPSGAMWSHVLKRGTALRLTALEAGANVGAIFYNFENLVERYNMPDTLKAQHIARLTAGSVLYSDMGRILCSITEDSVGWHDPIGGCSNAAMLVRKYGASSYQESRNEWHQNGHDSFLTEIGKYGMGERDLIANVNFFSNIINHLHSLTLSLSFYKLGQCIVNVHHLFKAVKLSHLSGHLRSITWI